LPKGKWNEDDDVTEVIGVTKYESSCERQERLRDEVKSNRIKKFMMRYNWFRSMFVRPSKKPFPSFIRKTDEDRIQLFPRICEEHKDTYFSVTEKLDGQSGTYFMLKSNRKWYEFWIPKFVFGVCSRNFHLVKEDNSTWWTIYRQVDMKSALQFLFDGMKAYSHVVIQGEIIGEGIQGNKYGIKGIDFYLFNIYIDGELMDNEDMFAIDWNIKNVPFLYNLFRLEPTIQQSVEKAKGESQIADTIREGIVVRNYEKNISFKIINPDFLLKWDL
jgi:RNA ligase (TIGR02306 family)